MGCYNAVVLNAPADTVWSALRNFHDLSWSPNVVTDVKVVGDAGATDIGAQRVLNDAFHETLHVLDDDNRFIKYSIDDGPGPTSSGNVSGYFGEVRVLPVTVGAEGDQTAVVWTSSWDTENGEGGSVAEFCDPIYAALLTDMKGHFG
jgi:hypothetical protein